MFFKELRIRGFKSFADPCVLQFKQGITGVVGPNGCGKSNLMDAVRWVLGEQRSSVLRVTRIEELLFNGTHARKAHNVAEVSLLLEDTKNLLGSYTEVQLTRRLYRQGESVFEINGVRARLKDITHLIMDSGIGLGAYSIIELSMIEQVLQNKDGMRSQLMEQAAGLAKYKLRKKETLAKLASTEEDMIRVEDILGELMQNITALEKQASKTKKFKSWQQQHEGLEKERYIRQQAQITADKKRMTEQWEAEKAQYDALQAKISSQEADITTYKNQAVSAEKALQEAQKKANSTRNAIQEQENQLKLNTQENSLLTEKQQQQQARIIDLEAKKTEKITQQQTSLTHKKQADQQSQQSQQALEKLEAQQKQSQEHLLSCQEALTKAATNLHQHNQNLQNLQNQQQLYHNQQTLLQEQQQTLTQEHAQRKQEQKEIHQQIESYKQDLTKLSHQQQSLALSYNTEQKAYKAVQTSIEALQRDLVTQEQDLSLLIKERDFLEHQRQHLQGFSPALSFLRQQEQANKAPLLMEILHVVPSYEAALLAYLREYAQYFVLHTTQQAQQAVALLQEHKKGSAGFFILALVPPAKQTAVVSDSYELLQSHISCEPAYQPLVDWLLQGVAVNSNTEDLPKQLPKGIHTLVYNDGSSLLHPPYHIGGQAATGNQSLLGCLNKIKALTQEIEQRKQAITTQKETINQHQHQYTSQQESVEQAAQATQATISKIEQIQSKLIALGSTQEGLSQQINQLIDKQKTLKETNQGVGNKITQSTEEQTQLTQKQSLIAQAHDLAQSNYNTQQTQTQELNTAYQEQRLKHTQAQAEQKHQDNNYAQLQIQITELTNDLTQETTAQHTLTQRLKEQIAQLPKQQTQIDALYKQAKSLHTDLSQREEAFYAHQHKIQDLQEAIHQDTQKQNNRHRLGLEWEAKLKELTASETHSLDRIQGLFNKSWEALAVYARASKHSDEELARACVRCQKNLEEIGRVNWLAEEEHEKMQQRCDFINKEKEDLLSAKENLFKSLKELDQAVHTRFMNTFDAVNKHFGETFKCLFDQEDQAYLKLLNPETPSTSAIDIVAQPKGKRPMHIEQLSSGEKALTTLALLVALYLYQPSPFCILDEVDAPLDDANSEKLGKLLRDLSTRAQCIVMTHNKCTMQYCNTLYGFTMPEKGVTKVLPVHVDSL